MILLHCHHHFIQQLLHIHQQRILYKIILIVRYENFCAKMNEIGVCMYIRLPFFQMSESNRHRINK